MLTFVEKEIIKFAPCCLQQNELFCHSCKQQGVTTQHNQGNSLAIDSFNNIFIMGFTESNYNPTTSSAYDTS
jgi:hypothetical protein